MENLCCRIPLHDSHLASRKAEESAWRRFQSVAWLESVVGPLGLSPQPSELEFLSCLRNGLVLCNAINKIRPGSVPKVVESHSPLLTSEFQPLPAFQYFENVRNFLVAVEELKLPNFEASDLERDTLEAGSTTKIVDCILALKSYHEWKQCGGVGNGSWKYGRSPIISHSSTRTHSCSPHPCRRLDMSAAATEKQQPIELGNSNDLVDSVAKLLAGCLYDTKENIDQKLLGSFSPGNLDSVKSLTRILASCLKEEQLNKYPELKPIFKDLLVEGSSSFASSLSAPIENSSTLKNYKCFKSCLDKGKCNHHRLLKAQEKDLMELKALLLRIKEDFKALQFQLQSDLMQLGSQVQGLSIAALGYHRVVKENRNLYNTLMDLKGNIRVYCRVRPTLGDGSVIDSIGDDGSLIIVDPLKPQNDSRKLFQFNRVFGPNATQEEVFKDTQPLIRSVMDGYNVCIFAYGQTGSGKTHTMCGPPNASDKDMGINYLALNDLFQISCNMKDVVKYEVRVQMVEIYNEQVRDLLVVDGSNTKLEIRNCMSNGGSNLPDANMHLVGSTMDVINLMNLGEKNRVVCSTAINNRSSRSHSILTVHVQGKDTSGSILRSCLHLVDLAGSERVDKSEVTGDRLKEAQHINKSLSCLGDVITALAQKNSHIPYRNSKLTQLLQDSLGGHAKTLMFAHMSPEADSYGETISTLKFAQRVSTVELGTARLNKESSEVRELKEQIESLKKALARKEKEDRVPSHKVTGPRSPLEKTKIKSERTPPRPRRLSIESPGVVKSERTPPRSRRLSIESPSVVKTEQIMNPSDRKESRTLPSESKFKTEYARAPIHLQRLGLDGTAYRKIDPLQNKKSKEAVWEDGTDYDNFRSLESNAKTQASPHCVSTPSNATCQFQIAPMESRKRIPQMESRTRIPLRPKSPEAPILAGHELQIMTPNEHGLDNKTQLTSLSSTNRKGSQIKKSLKTFGKLISGSERRNQPFEAYSPIYPNNHNNGEKTPITANARVLRRQSLTGVQTSGSRRSSLGGKLTDSYSNGIRNSKTPPPIRPSSNTAKRWL
ncbi:P-loop nucleoside triphosphate hydrolases superfamily protein with CH (Calponin Homology) domain-containing protein isoform X2 [Tasmannia lanceolata]|uniref:P-loop nucleoside triphosphate hydrolases superfamily protein with CH (Calponin Homology) domain-containing protein isoform X2 n=1 Tax=Tasmannia lanceolata TaxID=3420 RepID=UPI004062E684